MTNTRWFLVALALTACTSAPKEAGPEEEPPLDGAYDSFRSPIDHEDMPFGRPVTAELTREEGFHAWSFTLDDDASIALRTEAESAGGPSVDTMIYLYREGARGWGRVLASNDDAPGTLYSALSRQLYAGRYRVLVKGFRRSSTGPFALVAECAGDGCTPDDGCLFGDSYRAIGWSTRVIVASRVRWTSTEGLSELERAQVVVAVHQSSHTDVTTAEEAFERVDQSEINRLELVDMEGVRAFTALEYGAGDNSYGAIFVAGTTQLAAHIHDGDLLDCAPSFEVPAAQP